MVKPLDWNTLNYWITILGTIALEVTRTYHRLYMKRTKHILSCKIYLLPQHSIPWLNAWTLCTVLGKHALGNTYRMNKALILYSFLSVTETTSLKVTNTATVLVTLLLMSLLEWDGICSWIFQLNIVHKNDVINSIYMWETVLHLKNIMIKTINKPMYHYSKDEAPF